MKKTKNEKFYVPLAGPEYAELEFEVEKSLAAREEMRAKKRPTSVALDEKTINELKALAELKGIPYQVLMRSYILEGIRKDKKAT
jgi:predicted DNA binding CopG/RHH family protein